MISKTSDLAQWIRSYVSMHPEWWVWLVSVAVWCVLVLDDSFFHGYHSLQSANLIACLPSENYGGEAVFGSILKSDVGWSEAYRHIALGLVPWCLMIFAMMFPLLKRSVRHVAFSLKQQDRNLGILLFLLSYAATWLIGGIFFLSFPFLLEMGTDTGLSGIIVNTLAALLFLLAALQSWHPSRRKVMMKCEWTAPIRLSGWSFYRDTLHYGATIGLACMRMCGVAMAALMLTNHNLLIMLLVSAIVLVERYFVSHESRTTGYLWFFLASGVLFSGIIV